MIQIFTTLSDAYYPRLRVFSRTLRKHTVSSIQLTILHINLSDKNITEFRKISQKMDLNVRFIQVDKKLFEDYKLIHHITPEAYTKLLLLQVYPTEERALWIDVDTIVLRDIQDLYQEDINDVYVLGTPEDKGKLDIERLKLGEDAAYINAGVILFNLKKIREDFSPTKLLEIYDRHRSSIRFADQDVINLAFSSKVKKDENKKYNYTIRSGHKMSKEEKSLIRDNVYIVHYIRHIKPWHFYYQGSARLLYLREMFPIYPFKSVFLLAAGEFYKLFPNKKTLENSNT